MNDQRSETPDTGALRPARDKILSLDELARLAEKLRGDGRKIVLCHGVFDLLHMGHVRHMEAARREGDVLIVTVTAGAHVNKGPGRPIFPDHMRAEMLAAIEYVDYVGVNDETNAENVLRKVRPDVYVKGSDYENPDEDITGKIDVEREAVENYGGRLVFTKDITFSSSALINRYLDVYDPPLRDYLDGFRNETTLDEIIDLIESVRDKRVLLIGDTIIDEYRYVEPLGKPSKENIIATQSKGSETFAGGIAATANHVADFCAEVDILTVLGDVDSGEELIRENLRPNVGLTPLYREGGPTTRKTRFVDTIYMRKLFEVYTFDDSPFEAERTEALNRLIVERSGDYDVIIVTDFGHGMISSSVVDAITENARFLAVSAQTNAGNQGFNLITKYPRADYLCIDGSEARLAVSDKFSDLAVLASESLPGCIDCSRLIVTGGIQGCVTFDAAKGLSRIPVFTKTVVDTVGAGDAFLAVTAPLVAAGGDMERIGFIGNAAGAMKVGIVGHRSSIEKVPLVKFLTTLMK